MTQATSEVSLRRASLALTHAIRYCPQDAPLHASLLGLLCPLAAAAEREHTLDIHDWKLAIKRLIDFADDVKGLLPSGRGRTDDEEMNIRLDGLNMDAINLFHELDGRGIFTAFAPTFMQRQFWDRVFSCFSQAPGDGLVRDPILNRSGVKYDVLFRSLDTFYSCVERLLNTEGKLHHLAQALLSFIKTVDSASVKAVSPSADTKCPQIDVSRYIRICQKAKEYEARLNRSSVPQNDAEQIEKLITQLRLTGYNFKGSLDFDLTNSSIRFPTILGATTRSVVYPAILHAKDDFRNASWDMNIAIKVYIPTAYMVTREMYFRHQALRLQTLSHPCLLHVHDTFWPLPKDGRVKSDVLVITELMTHNLRSAQRLRAFRSASSRVRLLLDITQGLKYLHQCGVSHQALSPNNVLVRVYQDEWCGHAKIDVSNILNGTIFEKFESQDCLNLQLHTPPETLLGEDQFFTGDIWSLGVLICFLFGGSPPKLQGVQSPASYSGQIDTLVAAAQMWCDHIDDVNIRKLATECLHKCPEERPTAAKVMDCLELLKDDTKGLMMEVEGDVVEDHIDDVTLDSSHGAASVSEDRGRRPKLTNHSTITSADGQSSLGTGKDVEHSHMKRSGPSDLSNPTKRRRQNEASQNELDWIAADDGRADQLDASVEMQDFHDSDGSGTIIRRGRRRSLRKSSTRNLTKDNEISFFDEEPEPNVNDVESAQPVATVSAIGKLKAASTEKDGQIELYLPSDTRDGRNRGTPGVSGNILAVADATAANSNEQIAEAKRMFAPKSANIDKHEVYLGPKQAQAGAQNSQPISANLSNALAQHVQFKYDVQLQTFEDLNRFAESLQESGKPGCTDEAARLFKAAAEAGFAKAQVNYGICLEQGRGVEPDSCEAAMYFQDAANQGDARGQLKIGLCHELGKGTKKDFKVASEWYAKSADQGHPQAQTNLGMAYQYGRGVQRDITKAVKMYHNAAAAGNNIAQLNLGVLYENGQGVEKDLGKAVELYRQSAAKGSNRAMLNLALCLERGNGVEKSIVSAAVYFVKAAEAGNCLAMFKAGQCFHKGEGVKQNLTKAAHYYNRAANAENHVGALYNLGILYENGTGVISSFEKAFYYYKEAANSKHAGASYKLALCYKTGIGVKPNRNLVVQYYKQAATLGNANAKLELGYLYENGEGVKKSCETAVRLYREAASAGLPQAEWALGQCHYFGYGMTKNVRAAVKLFESAVEKGNDGACLELGNLYKEGNDVEQDMKKAFQLYEIGAKRGNSECQVNCGECYFYGKGTQQDYTKAVSYFHQAAKQYDPEGYRWLGDCYADGCGVPEDRKKAADFFRRGAEMKKDRSSPAECCLGECYEKGLGVEKDGAKALMYYKRSAGRNNGTAMNNLGIMYENGHHVKQDYATAFRYYEKAVNVGLTDAFCNLADCYAAGNGVRKNLVKAAELYKQGAEHGLPEAQCELGVCYYYGKGVDRDRAKGIQLLQKASASEPEAMRHLGVAYWDGFAVTQDFAKAYELVSKAAEAGNVDAYFNLGIFYEMGTGVETNAKKAAEYYQQAAEKGGNKLAMRFLGNLYFEGQGVEKDEDMAMQWFEKASLDAQDIFDSINV